MRGELNRYGSINEEEKENSSNLAKEEAEGDGHTRSCPHFQQGSKKLIRAKIVKPGCTASCRLGCGYKLTDAVKEELHKTFYQLPTRDHQQSFIVSSVSRSSPKRTTVQDDQQRKKERGNTFVYHVTVKGEAIRVCKTTFQATFDLSDGRIARAMKGILQNRGAAAPDKSGKSTTSRVSIEARERVKTHIESFVAREERPQLQRGVPVEGEPRKRASAKILTAAATPHALSRFKPRSTRLKSKMDSRHGLSAIFSSVG